MNLVRIGNQFMSALGECDGVVDALKQEAIKLILERANCKRISKNVYAKTREECEEKLAELIKTMKAEIAAEKKKAKQA